MSKNYRTVLREASALLQEAGVDDADLDAWYLLSHVSGMDRARYFMDQMESIPPGQEEAYRALTAQRAQRIPLQHLLGEAWFMGLPFYVNENVLIPRQDTEKLVELVLDAQKQADRSGSGNLRSGKGRVLDMCTGSGCIAVSLDVLGSWASVTAADISGKALEVARRNVERNHSQVVLIHSDLFSSLEGECYDVIVSNPPYIPTAQCDELMPEVRDHDPRLALDGREDGLYFYRKLAEECPGHLAPGGRIFWEIGWDQGEAVCGLLREAGFHHVDVIADDTGKDRVVTGEWLCLTD